MDAVTALRLERVRIDHEAGQRIIEQQARWITAMLVVTLSLAGGAVLSVAAGQVPAPAGATVGVPSLAITSWLAWNLRRLPHETRANARKAGLDVERLILEQGEHRGDGETEDARRAQGRA